MRSAQPLDLLALRDLLELEDPLSHVKNAERRDLCAVDEVGAAEGIELLAPSDLQAIKACGVPFKAVNVFDDEEIYRQGVKVYSNWPTIPQLFVNGELVGGSDIVIDMFQSGELKTMLENAANKG